MSLEDGLEPLEEGDVEIGGLRLRIDVEGDDGLDDLPEVEGDTADAAGDGEDAGEQRFASREVTLKVSLRPVDGSGPVEPGDHDWLAAQLNELRKVTTLLPDRRQTRLLRFRRRGEIAKRGWYLPPRGKPLQVPGGQERQAFANAVATVRLVLPKPFLFSDELHSHTFAAGETAPIVNAGSQAMVKPSSWRLTAPGAVTLEHLGDGEPGGATYPSEYLRFPGPGALTVSEDYEIQTPTTYNIVEGRAGSWHPTWICLRPGVNLIRASAPCTIWWRDSF